jgi:hypothetical protein
MSDHNVLQYLVPGCADVWWIRDVWWAVEEIELGLTFQSLPEFPVDLFLVPPVPNLRLQNVRGIDARYPAYSGRLQLWQLTPLTG